MAGDVETKLSAARTRLILEKPFLGALVLRMPLVEGAPRWCRTTATDARKIYYNRRYIEGLTLDQTKFVLAHEALHCALCHFVRRQHRVKQRWDLACDLAVNPLLIDDGLVPPPNALYLEEFAGMTAEEIYPLIEDFTDEEPLDDHVYDGDESGDDSQGAGDSEDPHNTAAPQGGSGSEQDAGAARPRPLRPDEREQLATQWQQRLAGAAQQAMQAGKLGGLMGRMVDFLLQPQLPWRMLLARYMTTAGRDDFNYSRPSRREGEAILPSLRSAQIDLVVAIDTSGSIRDEEMRQFVSEVDALKGQIKARVTLLACDAQLAAEGPWEFEPWEAFELPPNLSGGGGTDFRPVFEWAERRGRRPDLLLYFTDAQGEFPRHEPPYPVLWLVKGRGQVPWGQRIQLN